MGTINLVTEIPGPKSKTLVARREAAVPRGASKLTHIAIDRAQGAAVHDVDGNTLLDFAGGIGALAAGHCPPGVVSALQAQAEKLIHLCAIVGTYEPYVRVAELLNEVTPGDHDKKTVLMNSGAEAVETAVKIARAHTGRQAVIVFEGGYHGAHEYDNGNDQQIRAVQKRIRPLRAGNLPPALPESLSAAC